MKGIKHRVTNITISPLKNISKEDVMGYEPVVDMVINETPKAIEHALNTRKTLATIMEINNSGTFIQLEDKWWPNALSNCLKKYEDNQDYEKCTYISNLLNRVEKSKIPTTEKIRLKK